VIDTRYRQTAVSTDRDMQKTGVTEAVWAHEILQIAASTGRGHPRIPVTGVDQPARTPRHPENRGLRADRDTPTACKRSRSTRPDPDAPRRTGATHQRRRHGNREILNIAVIMTSPRGVTVRGWRDRPWPDVNACEWP